MLLISHQLLVSDKMLSHKTQTDCLLVSLDGVTACSTTFRSPTRHTLFVNCIWTHLHGTAKEVTPPPTTHPTPHTDIGICFSLIRSDVKACQWIVATDSPSPSPYCLTHILQTLPGSASGAPIQPSSPPRLSHSRRQMQ